MAADSAPSPGTIEGAAKSTASEADLLTRIGGLNAHLETAQRDIADLQKSNKSWFKKAGILLGFLAGVFAIPRAYEEAKDAIFPQAQTSVDWGKPLNMQYDLHNHVLRLDFPVVTDNEGVANDSIEEVYATVRSDAANSQVVPVGNSDIDVSDQGKSIVQPIPIQSKQTRSLVIGLSVNSPFSEQVLSLEGRRTVDVVLKTRGHRTITRKYCFDFDKDQNQELLAAKEMHIWTPTCE